MNYRKEMEILAPGLNRGFFIALEGIDGAGKSTQAARLTARLAELGLSPAAVREPTSGQWGQKLRGLSVKEREEMAPALEAELFVRDRAEDVAGNIVPALRAGRPVVADRYIVSNIAYQSPRGLTADRIMALNKDFPWPDLIVVLDVPLELGQERLAERTGQEADPAFEGAEYQAGVRRVFNELELPNLIRLDGRQSPEDITEAIIEELHRRELIRDQMPRIVDSHCHLSVKGFEGDLAEVLERARRVGVRAIMDVGLDAEHSRQVIERAASLADVHPIVGWHPHDVKDMSEEGFQALMELAGRPEVLGFGEIGLDFCLMHSSRECQLAAFEKLLEAATGLDLPIVIHSRDAFDDTYRLLKKYAPRLKRPGIIHCFTRGWEEASAYLDLGFYLSLPGVVTFPKSEELREVAAKIPADRLLVETDAPYMAPAPFRGKRNEPSYLIYHLNTIAEARGLSLNEAASLTTANAYRIFGI
ncbi:dTMP kinase [Deltaproteobacteria bacterium Smac51]|nr:dTMP kinase [Deltaproteobacteria bacterium Smac51]